jgi:hypothetical protein
MTGKNHSGQPSKKTQRRRVARYQELLSATAPAGHASSIVTTIRPSGTVGWTTTTSSSLATTILGWRQRLPNIPVGVSAVRASPASSTKPKKVKSAARTLYWCEKCKICVPKNKRLANRSGRGWKCPQCGVGLPRKPMFMMDEVPGPEDLLDTATRDLRCS